MSKVLQRGAAIVAVLTSLVFATSALAQMPTSPWKKGAPFPEADEELYGVPSNGKLYVFGGFGGGKARGIAYEYDPATDRWTKKTSMPRPAHHAALAAANGKIYVMGGFVPPSATAIPVGGAWGPIDHACEHDPAAHAPLPPATARSYVMGGFVPPSATAIPVGGAWEPIDNAWEYDPAADSW